VINNQNGELPDNAWERSTPFKTNSPGERSAAAYREVLNAFNVETTKRYIKSDGKTYCNVFVSDATLAMGAEIPHRVNSVSEGVPQDNGGTELTASMMYDWLADHGATYGWNAITAEEAIVMANAGYPTVAVCKSMGSGHIAMVVSQESGDTGVMITQAGGSNFNYKSLSSGFGGDKTVLFYAHE
jgi:hypothetical protein